MSTKGDPRLPDLLTPDEVAEWLRTSRKGVYSRAERGKIPGATHLGGRLYFRRDLLLRWLEQGRVPTPGG